MSRVNFPMLFMLLETSSISSLNIVDVICASLSENDKISAFLELMNKKKLINYNVILEKQ